MTHGLILGASSGIGKAFYDNYTPAGHGWDIPTKAELDVSLFSVWWRWFEEHEPYDQVVFSAGINYLEWLGSSEHWRMQEVVDTNLNGFMYMMNALAAAQPEHPARVVVVGSDAAERPLRTSIAYCASKAGLHMAARVAARELGPKGWRINVVAPGMTDNTGMQEYVDATVPFIRGWTEEHMRSYEAQQEVVPGRMQPVEVAQIIHDTLTGPDHLNGSIITLNGGR